MGQTVLGTKLVAALLIAVAHYTGFAVPSTPPELRFLPLSDLQQRFCGLPCPIRAFFPSGSVIYLDRKLDVLHDRASESVLVHELTHWLQQANLAHRTAQSCQEWLDREYQAFDVQYRWLRDTSPNIREFSLAMTELGHQPLIALCPSPEAGHPTTPSDSALAAMPR